MAAADIPGGRPDPHSGILQGGTEMNLASYIRTVPDFPIPGILFRDITPLLRNPDALRTAVDKMAEPWQGQDVDLVAAMEARGFMFRPPMPIRLRPGLVPSP